MAEYSRAIMKHLFAGLMIRLLMLMYGLYQDETSVVKYTDIDYSVYSDAALYLLKGSSPYLRETYRYTPILAWLLTPNWTFDMSYGKILFVLFDIITSYLIYLIVKNESGGERNDETAVRWSFLWIYNPLPIIICTRGSSEAIILSLVLAVIFFFQRGAVLIAGVLYGFAVHFKPYTLPFCLPLYLASRIWVPMTSGNMKLWLKNFLTIGPTRVKLILGSLLGFGLPTAACYYFYGYEFLEETYFYHLTRKDIKHNFSLYFYLLYLNSNNDGILLKLAGFLPQAFLLGAVALIYPSRNDLCFTLFVQTYCFVIFNKVSTSQYFLWYLSILPVLGPKLEIKWTHAGVLVMVWYFAQLSWLLPAYYLEFEGRNTFLYIWLESIAFFCCNIGILTQLIKSYRGSPLPKVPPVTG